MDKNTRRPTARVQGTQGPKSAQDYLKDLDSLLKRNTGQGMYQGQDVSSNVPMYLPGKVQNPFGIAEAASNRQGNSMIQEPRPVTRDEPYVQPEPEQEQSQNMSVEDFLGAFNQAYNAPENQQQFGDPRVEFIASTQDGGSLMADGTIVYDDGTIRMGDPNAIAIRSNADGSTGYSDGSSRKAAPDAIRSVNGQRERIGYSDGSTRFGQYQYGEGQPVNQPGGLQGLISGIFGQQRPITQQYGNINPIEPTAGNVNLGTDIRTRDLQGDQRGFKLPVGAEVVEVLQDDGTRFGERSGHQGYGNSILVRLATGEMLRFSHMSQMADVQPGQRIEAGTVFGQPGTTGNTYGEHLDLEYYDRSGKIANPTQFSGFSDPQGLRSPLPGQPAPGTLDRGQSQVNSQIPQQNQQSQPQSASPNYTGQTLNENIVQPAANVFQQAATAQLPNSAVRTAVGGKVNELGNVFAEKGVGTSLGNSPQGFIGAGEALKGDLPGAGKELSATIERTNPTPRIDTGISEALRGDFAGAKTNFLDTASRVGNRLSKLPGEIANEVVKPAYADDGSQKSIQDSLGQNVLGAANSIGNYAQSKFGQAGEGIKSLGQAGISALDNVFKPKQDTAKRAVGDVTGTALEPGQSGQFSSLMDTASSMANLGKNDVRDPFYKLGGAETYKQYINPKFDIGSGALSLDTFTPDFYKDSSNISSVFGGSALAKGATDKFVEFEKQKFRPMLMERMEYQDGYDREEIDKYNRVVDEYNVGVERQINDYFNQVRSGVQSTPSAYQGAPTGSAKNVFSGTNSSVAAPVIKSKLPSFTAQFASINKPAVSAPSLSRPSLPQQSNRPGSSAPQMSVMPAPKAAPKPTQAIASLARPVTNGAFSSVNSSVRAPSKPSGPVMSKAPAPQSKPSSNVFSRVSSTIKNIFRR